MNAHVEAHRRYVGRRLLWVVRKMRAIRVTDGRALKIDRPEDKALLQLVASLADTVEQQATILANTKPRRRSRAAGSISEQRSLPNAGHGKSSVQTNVPRSCLAGQAAA